MAKGLFAVYQDSSDLPTSLPTRIRASTSTGTTKQHYTSAGESTSRVKGSVRVLGEKKGGKENLNPFGMTGNLGGLKKSAAPAKGKGVASCSTSSSSLSSSISTTRVAKSFSSVPSTNGVCTGTLRTREINFPISSSTPAPKSIPSRAGKVIQLGPAISSFKPSLTILRHTEEGMATIPAHSAKDSGYGDQEDEEEVEMEMVTEDGAEAEVQDSLFGRESEGDKRARALTESPLAEITQAFQPFGSFSLSPTPLPTHPIPSPTLRRISPPLSPTRASRSISAHKAAITKPYVYSTTTTTRKIGRDRKSVDEELERIRAGGSMRV